jgi:hypothetical protein
VDSRRGGVLSEGFRKKPGSDDLSPSRRRLSWGSNALQSLYQSPLTPVLVRRSLLALYPEGWASRSSRARHLGTIRKPSPGTSLGLVLPFRVHPNLKRPLRRPQKRTKKPTTSFLEVSSPTAFSQQRDSGFRYERVCLTRTANAYRFSQPLDAFIRPAPAGLVSCQIRSWGSPFGAFLLPRSRTPSLTPLPS